MAGCEHAVRAERADVIDVVVVEGGGVLLHAPGRRHAPESEVVLRVRFPVRPVVPPDGVEGLVSLGEVGAADPGHARARRHLDAVHAIVNLERPGQARAADEEVPPPDRRFRVHRDANRDLARVAAQHRLDADARAEVEVPGGGVHREVRAVHADFGGLGAGAERPRVHARDDRAAAHPGQLHVGPELIVRAG